ncbi:DUF2085 domain-containing protein [Halopiger aswanensis]|uniref:Putative membrane protein n=1 Tax=Halopiger aswanensis TaxID=148449 RepID=A0A419WRY7_9EURY|nr:DUF2085 domain-containing protein [Halopiger aswanensis]RKD98253.1 putative membrane protein [Halopiger aswanensis]
MKIDPAELRAGLAETRRFVLSHHLPSEYHRCYSPSIGDRRVHVCARCLGVYPGIAMGVLTALFLLNDVPLALVALLPLPALCDWALTTFRPARGSNVIRTATGTLLGCGYGLGVALFLLEHELAVLGIGAVYAVIAGFLLTRAW